MGGVYEENSGYIPPFLEGFRHRISQKSILCLISIKFFGGQKLLPIYTRTTRRY